MISEAAFKIFDKYKRAGGHAFSSGEVVDADKDIYQQIYRSLREAAELAIAGSGYSEFFEIRSSRFSRDGGVQGQRPVDMWTSVVNKESGSFGGYPQTYLIASEVGLEVGFAASIHESDYFNADLKRRNRTIIPILYEKLPAPHSALITKLDAELATETGWQFGLKSRQGSRGNFGSLKELIEFLKSPQSDLRGGGSVFRIISPQQIGQADFDLVALFTNVVKTFAPLMRTMVPSSGDQTLIIEKLLPSELERSLVKESEFVDPGDQDDASVSRGVWVYAPGRNAEFWDDFYEQGIMAIGWDDLGDLMQYGSVEEMIAALDKHHPSESRQSNNARTCFDFARTMRPGDLVFAKRGRSIIIGHGIVTGEYEFVSERPKFKHVRKVRWESKGQWNSPEVMALKTLTEITAFADIVEQLKQLTAVTPTEPPAPLPTSEREAFNIDDAMNDLFVPREDIERALRVWRTKKNLILQGAPGVGKSFVAKRLAYALMGFRDPTRVRTVQFHQSYSYEDFVQGYRPDGKQSFELKPGVFLEFCERARTDPDENYVLIIDEINRGNLSRIFGELMLLIEPDKRSSDWATKLAYAKSGEERFYVPSNVYILGLMNTADRSLSLVDYALRRRFGFITLKPQFAQPAFREKLSAAGCSPELASKIIARLSELNDEIAADNTNLGPGFCVGHSFFVPSTTSNNLDDLWYNEVIETEIRPLLEEYWSDDLDHAERSLTKLLEG